MEAVRSVADHRERKKMKERTLPAFSVSGIFSGRRELEAHSHYICIDIDAKDNEGVKDFDKLKDIISQVPCVEYCGLSASGAGYFCIIPIADPDKHGAYFRSLQHNFKRCGLIIDDGCGDITRLRYVSFDPSPYVNTGATVYDYVLPDRKADSRKADGTPITLEAEARQICAALDAINESHTDITGSYHEWFKILCSIAATFGEDGREYAHRVSQEAECYTFEETERKYTDILKHKGYSYNLGTFYYYFRRYSAQMDFDGMVTGEDGE